MRTVAAFDMSLTAFGVVVAPLAWDGDRKRLDARTLVTKPEDGDIVTRAALLTRDVVRICRHYRVTDIWAEDLPTHGAYSVVQLAELRGIVRHGLRRAGCPDVHFVQARQARDLLYGCNPPPGATKAWLLEPLKLIGLPVEDDAQGDAFVVLNYGMSELGGYTLAGLCAPKDKARARKQEVAEVFREARRM